MLTMFYLVSYGLITAVLNIVLKKFLQRHGVIGIILHSIPIIAFQFLLTLEITWWVCLLVAFLAAVAQALYSVPLNLLFSFTDKEVNVAKFQIPTNIGKLVFIILSGYVIGSSLNNSVLVLAIVGTVLYIASSIPLIYGYKLIKESYDKIANNPPVVDKKSYHAFNLFHIAFSVFQSVLDYILPLYLYMENLAFESVAIVMALIELCKIGSNMFANFLVKKNREVLSVVISSICMIVGVIVIMIVKVPVVLYVCSCVIAVSFPLLFVPMFAAYVKKLTKDNNQFDGMTSRDIYIMFAKEILFLPYLVVPSFLGQFVIGIGAAALISVCATKILVDKKNKNSLL